MGCDPALDGIALDNLWPILRRTPNYLDVWMNRDYGKSTQGKIDDAQKIIDKHKNWAIGLKDPCVKKAYLKWIDHYQRELDTARTEMTTKAQKIEMDAYDAKLKREAQERESYEKIHGRMPVPPK